ncbi:MAG: hypothetical protein PUC82_02430 [bacterium]|nr:hypothetical protein [bacterium]
MTTYIGQLSNRIEINKRKLTSLEEYKATLLASKENIDKDLLADRLEQIDTEFLRLKKAIHANKKAIAHYDAAYNHLIDLRLLDNELQLTHDEEKTKKLEAEVIEHTNKLQKHLSILPEKLVNELQEAYRKYVEENPIVNVAPSDEEESKEPLSDFTNSVIYLKLLEIFEEEKKEFNDIKVFNSPKELEQFLNKYYTMKMDCYTSLAILNNIGDRITSEIPVAVESTSEDIEEESMPEPIVEEPPRKLPIITMLNLVDGLEIGKTATKKLHATNIKAKEPFKDELKNATWLYNVIHSSARLIHIADVDSASFMKEIANTEVNQKRLDVLKARIAKLGSSDIISLYNEYYNSSSMASLPTALEVLITERAKALA